MKTGIKQIDRIYCINLDRRRDRWEKVEKHFFDRELKVHRFSAVDGSSLLGETTYRSGVFGCFSSHINVLEDAISQGFKRIIILEDDAVLHPSFISQLEIAFENLPFDWKLCYLGGSNMKRPNHLKGNVSICVETLSTVGYMIDISFAKDTLLPTLKSLLGTIEIDAALTKIQQQNEIHILDPRVVYQSEDFSDIQHKLVNYSHQRDF